MKTLERLLFLWIVIAAIGACLNACGGAPPTCLKPTDTQACFIHKDGVFYRYAIDARGVPGALECDCAEWSQP